MITNKPIFLIVVALALARSGLGHFMSVHDIKGHFNLINFIQKQRDVSGPFSEPSSDNGLGHAGESQNRSKRQALKGISFDQFKNAITSNGYGPPSQKQYNNFMKYAESKGKISSKREAAMCLAQLIHESGGLKKKVEDLCKTSGCPEEYKTPGCDVNGKHYFGRGYIQLTWCYNYRAASKALFNDERLVKNPESVAEKDDIAWQTAFWFWGANVHNRPGVAEGRFGATTKAINGALECSSPGNPKAASRFRIYGKVRKAFGLKGAGNSAGCE